MQYDDNILKTKITIDILISNNYIENSKMGDFKMNDVKDSIEYTSDLPQFSTIPTNLLRDKRVSARAKGIYAVIFDLISLAKAFPDNPTLKVTNSKILETCTEGRKALNSAIQELKENGYLILNKQRNPIGKGYYIYSYKLQATPIPVEKIEKNKEVKNNKHKNNTKEELSVRYKKVLEYVNTKIVYQSWQNKTLGEVLDYNQTCDEPDVFDIMVRDVVESIRDIIVEVITTKSDYIKIAGYDRNINEVKSSFEKIDNSTITYILNSLFSAGYFTGELEVTNMHNYLLATIYNASKAYRANHRLSLSQQLIY